MMVYIQILILLFFSQFIYAFDDEALYHQIKKNYKYNFPNFLIAEVYSEFFEKILLKIPKAYYCIDNKKIEIKYLFSKQSLERIHVENVKIPFVNRFQIYLELYRSSKEFLEAFDHYQALVKIYEWNYFQQNKHYHVVKMQKRSRIRYHFILFFDKNFFLRKIEYYDNQKILGMIKLNYVKIKDFFFIKKLWIRKKRKNKWKNIQIVLKNFKTEFQIDNKKILSLQESCKQIKDILKN